VKKLDLLLSTMNTYPELYKNMELIVLCDSEMDNYIKEKAWNFTHTLVGKTTLENIFNIYCNVDLLVVPSKSESFGLVYTEALAVGVPVIGFYGVIDEFKTVLNTYIGEPFDPSSESEEDLKEKIVKCLTIPFDAALVKDNLIKNFSWEILYPKFLELYYPGSNKKNMESIV
jgi:glycosyltransferase involved in cell wall biosynthesis